MLGFYSGQSALYTIQSTVTIVNTNDNLILTIDEVSGSLLLSSVVDDLVLSFSEQSSNLLMISAGDTILISIPESLIVVETFVSTTDTVSVGMLETSDLLGFLDRTDSLSLSLADMTNVLTSIVALDNIDILIADVTRELIELGYIPSIFRPLTIPVSQNIIASVTHSMTAGVSEPFKIPCALPSLTIAVSQPLSIDIAIAVTPS